MPTSPSARLGLVAPSDVGDAINDGPDVIQAIIATLDPKTAVFDAGARASRPVSTPGSPGIAGRFYRSTDDGGIDYDYGTGWAAIAVVIDALTMSGSLNLASSSVVNWNGGDTTLQRIAAARLGVQSLDLTGSLKRPVLTALPGSPYDGQEILFRTAAMASIGMGPWQLRYNSASASAYKWEFIGGPAWQEQVSTSESTTSTSPVNLTTVGPSVTLPLSGDYLFQYGAKVETTAGGWISLTYNGTLAQALGTSLLETGVGTLATSLRANGRTAGQIIRMLYQSISGSSSSYDERWLMVTPIRVG